MIMADLIFEKLVKSRKIYVNSVAINLFHTCWRKKKKILHLLCVKLRLTDVRPFLFGIEMQIK